RHLVRLNRAARWPSRGHARVGRAQRRAIDGIGGRAFTVARRPRLAVGWQTVKRIGAVALAILLNSSQASGPTTPLISLDRLRDHVKTLASDRFEGRAPGTTSERLTVDYVVGQFKRYGLRGGNADGSYEQPVPLTSVVACASVTLTI